MNIAELASELRAELADCRARRDRYGEAARQAEAEAELIELMIDRIEATDEARAVTTTTAEPSTNGAAQRRARRDIRAMVRQELDASPAMYTDAPGNVKVGMLAHSLGCKRSQIEAALRALDGADEGG